MVIILQQRFHSLYSGRKSVVPLSGIPEALRVHPEVWHCSALGYCAGLPAPAHELLWSSHTIPFDLLRLYLA